MSCKNLTLNCCRKFGFPDTRATGWWTCFVRCTCDFFCCHLGDRARPFQNSGNNHDWPNWETFFKNCEDLKPYLQQNFKHIVCCLTCKDLVSHVSNLPWPSNRQVRAMTKCLVQSSPMVRWELLLKKPGLWLAKRINNWIDRIWPTKITSWWLNQPILKICSSNWKSSPIFGVKIKNIWIATT